MNKKRLCFLLGVFALCIVLGGCNNPFGKGKGNTSAGTGNEKPADKGKDTPKASNTQNFVPDDMKDSDLSALSSEQKAEIATLYGYYWMDGARDNCIEIGAHGLVAYSTAMSFRYRNVRWAKVSDSWVCSSYHANNSDYEPGDRKVILKFSKASGGIALWQYIVPMNRKAGPFKGGKAVEEIKKDGKTYYVYDKADSTSPKMLAPIPR